MSLKNSLKSPEVLSPVFVETVRQLHPLKRCAYDLIALCLESGVPQNCNGDFITGCPVARTSRKPTVRSVSDWMPSIKWLGRGIFARRL